MRRSLQSKPQPQVANRVPHENRRADDVAPARSTRGIGRYASDAMAVAIIDKPPPAL